MDVVGGTRLMAYDTMTTMMAKRTAKVANRLGLHARPAADFVRLANTFASHISVRKGRRVVNGKSIMGILTLAVAANQRVTIAAEGADATAAVHALVTLLTTNPEGPMTR